MNVHHIISIYFSQSLSLWRRHPWGGRHRALTELVAHHLSGVLARSLIENRQILAMGQLPVESLIVMVRHTSKTKFNNYNTYFFGVSCATAIFWRGPSNTAVPINQVWECLMLSGSEAWSSLDGVGFAKNWAMLYPRLGDYPKMQELLPWATWMTTKHWSISAGSHLILWNIHRR